MLIIVVGGFETDLISHAKVAGFNMWSYEMSLQQLNSLTCDDVGDLVKTSDMRAVGAGYTFRNFDCGKLCGL